MSLEAIVAFNDELEALVRAGIPLEPGLMAASVDYRGRLGRMLRDVAGRLESGEKLADAVSRSAEGMPEIYRAMIEAGTRSGRLAEALQGLTRISQAHLEARRTLTLAFSYPLLVLSLAYALLIFFLTDLWPRFAAAASLAPLSDLPVFTAIDRIRATVWIWGPIPPLVGVGLVVSWLLLGRSRSLDGAGRFAAWVPVVGRIIRNFQTANFTDLLGHLVRHDVPLDQSVRLAGAASGSFDLNRTSTQFARTLAQGQVSSTRLEVLPERLPPLVVWMLMSTTRQATLADGLAHLALSYRRKARRQAATFQVFLPGFLILTIGAGAVLAYGLLLFVPLHALWNGLANP